MRRLAGKPARPLPRPATILAASAAILAALLPAPAAAAQLAGVTLPDRVTVGETTLVLNGMGLREATWLKVDVYVAGLYLESKSSDPGEILDSDRTKRIVMMFVRTVGRKDLVKAWNESFEENSGKNFPAVQERVATLDSWMPESVAKGEAITFTCEPGKGVLVEIQGQARGTIPGTDFARVLFSIWLGPKPPNAGMKAGLLGRG